MANKKLFQSKSSKVPETDTINNAGGKAYSFSDKHSLAQIACTGCFGNTFYVKGEDQLATVKTLMPKVDDKFLAQLAVYSRNFAFMKDMPALIFTYLSCKESPYAAQIADKVLDNGRMVRNFVQMVRSGEFGRTTLRRDQRKQISRWLNDRKMHQLLNESVGNTPSLADIIKLVHPKPMDADHRAAFGYLIDAKEKPASLPEPFASFEAFKADPQNAIIPNIEFRLLTGLSNLSDKDMNRIWTNVARSCGWHALRMNLNSFLRHDVFKDKEMVKFVADRLHDRDEILRSKVMPYQLFAAYLNVDESIPNSIRNAIQDAVDVSLENVPTYEGDVMVCCDISGSMGSPASGDTRGKMKVIDVASMFSSAVLHKNPDARVILFNNNAFEIKLNSRDSVVTNAEKIRAHLGGGTNVAAPMDWANAHKVRPDLMVYFSDNESWCTLTGRASIWGSRNGTESAELWKKIKKSDSKLVLVDVTPNTTTQVTDSKNVLNVGGFSDSVFNVIDSFVRSSASDHWTKEIEKIQL